MQHMCQATCKPPLAEANFIGPTFYMAFPCTKLAFCGSQRLTQCRSI